jgi:programmed cell death protein 5
MIMNGGMDPNELAKLRQLEEMKKKVLITILSKDAYERLARVRVANPELAGQAELYILQVYQTGKLEGRITDEQMKEVLRVLSSGSRPDFNIRRK